MDEQFVFGLYFMVLGWADTVIKDFREITRKKALGEASKPDSD